MGCLMCSWALLGLAWEVISLPLWISSIPIWSHKQWHLPLKPRTGLYVLLCTHMSVCLLVHLLLI